MKVYDINGNEKELLEKTSKSYWINADSNITINLPIVPAVYLIFITNRYNASCAWFVSVQDQPYIQSAVKATLFDNQLFACNSTGSNSVEIVSAEAAGTINVICLDKL